MPNATTRELTILRPDALSTSPPSVLGAVWIPGGTFRMGSDRHYRRGAPGPPRDRRWLLDRPVSGDQRALRPLRRRDRLRHVRRDSAQRGRLPRRAAGDAVRRLNGVREAARPVESATSSNWWSFCRGADWRHPHGPQSSIVGLEQHPVVHVTYADAVAFAAGREGRCPRRRSGSSRPGVGSRARSTHGVTRRPRRTMWRTRGRASSPGRTCAPTAMRGRRRSTRSRLTGTVCTT